MRYIISSNKYITEGYCFGCKIQCTHDCAKFIFDSDEENKGGAR